MLTTSITKTLNDFYSLLSQLSNDEYSKPCKDLSNSSIGQHVRHSIELFQCLENQYQSGIINYDNRLRDFQLESDVNAAKNAIEMIIDSIDRPNKSLILVQKMDTLIEIDSNYNRELLYNLEHCIHHQALIKVALLQNEAVAIDENFGVAQSTIEYRKQCAQ
jgi:hypothetical protein